MYIKENKKIILFLELMVINRTTTSTEEEETSFHFDGNAAAAGGGAVCDSTSMDQRTCTSSHGQDLTSLYKIYIPLPAVIVK